ncbi:abscisic acid-deficient protein Aba4 family protein [Verrucomicrobiales bacterium BCK34]|nr:abscisic acid-deficient protein Aba4 family protein [Verrucomicrobiales bacterium BCK34]
MEKLFQLLSFSPGPFWLLIIFFPMKRSAMLAVDIFLILLSALFVALTLPVISELFPLIAKPEFESMHAFLSSKPGFVGSWNHMILSDLWIGRWVAQDTCKGRHGLPVRLFFIPPILFFGPLGLFCYLIFRIITRRRISLTETGA